MKKYYLGLDIGTNSVGWAVTDENYNIIKKNNFSFWGVRMFDEAKTAKERRTFRSSRRRLARRKERIELLQAEFLEEINKVDPNFFQRLNDSFCKQEDKLLNNHYTFFDDSMTDKEYFSKFPTIYHLRNHLITSKEKIDIRMLYLALHHIIKYRGNFLQEGEEFSKKGSNVINIINEINAVIVETMADFEDDEDYFKPIEINNEEGFLKELQTTMNEIVSKKDKTNKLKELFKTEKNTIVYEFVIPLLCGSKVNLSKLSLVKDEKYEKVELALNDEKLEENIDKAKSLIKELAPIFDLTYQIKEISDNYYLLKLLGDSEYLSSAMVKSYENYEEDLKKLKDYIRIYCKDKYSECFRQVKKDLNNYARYIGMTSVNGKTTRFYHCTKEKFYAYIKKIIDSVTDPEADALKAEFNQKMEKGEFLPRQNSGQNTALPMQLNLIELKQILENQAEHYDFLKKETNGLTTMDRIISIFEYHLPYYVGPLNNKSKYAWVVRNNEKIYPWNYKEVIDIDQTAEKFINRMQNKCTYLHGENDYCLSKKSLLFSEFVCLQYLNKLTLDGKPIDVELKNKIYQEVFLAKAKPTKKDIIEYLKSNYGYEESSLTSNIQEVPCDMSSYVKFKEIFGSKFNEMKDIIEEIIKDITIFEDKKILEKRLKEIYNLDDEKIKQIKGLNYKGYGSICKKLLTGIIAENQSTGEYFGSIIEIMRNTNQNLQQVLFNQDYGFINLIDEYNKNQLKSDKKLSIEDFIEENIYVSPIMKRPLIQAYKIIDEIERILKHPIDKFYIECSRTNKAEKKPSTARYEKVKALLAECEKDSKFINQNYIKINKLKEELEKNKDNLRKESLYLYFMQLGKCLYTLEDIDLDGIITGKYDIDHIYPQSLIKDDSFSNKVLTNKRYNQNTKKDDFLFEIANFHTPEKNAFWEMLLRKGLITKEKYRRLSEKEITEDKLNGFVNRQLVATNQSVKGLIEVLQQYHHVKRENIIYSKAENVSDFRKEFDFYKSRTANNYHHAHDAYLNIVIGRTLDNYYKYFGLNKYKDYLKLKNDNYTINPVKIFEKDRVYGKNIIWQKDETIRLLNKNIKNRFDISETTRTYNPNDLFAKTTIKPAGDGDSVPQKTKESLLDPKKYGGITSYAYCKYSIVELMTKKNEKEYNLEAIPKAYEKKVEEYINSLYDPKKYISIKVVKDNIKVNCIIVDGKKKYCVTGKSGKQFLLKNLKDRNFSYPAIKVIHDIEKYNNMIKKGIELIPENNEIIISKSIKDGKQKERKIDIKACELLLSEIKKMFDKDIYNYSIISAIRENLSNDTIKLKIKDFTIESYLKLLTELLKLLKTNERATADLTLIDLAKQTGTLYMSKKLEQCIIIMNESITGYYKNKIFEVPSGI